MATSTARVLPFFVYKYECQRHIGGNMSQVYLAYDARAERHVVVKLMRPEESSVPELRQRFLQEGRLACRCAHPNVITTHETDETEEGEPYIVMEHLQGKSLREWMDAGGFANPVTAIQVASQMAEALLYLHGLGILHRDIKPANIHVSDNGHAKIFDFGIARGGDFGLTRAGDVIGTPNYMAPEQILGKPVDQRTDIYSFGVVLFEMFAAALPYRGASIEEITALILHATPNFDLLRERQVPEQIVREIARCLEKAPENRPQSLAPVCEVFQHYLAEQSSQARAARTQLMTDPASLLDRTSSPATSPGAAASDAKPEAPRSSSGRLWIPIAAALVLAAAGAGLYFHSRTSAPVSEATSSAPPAAIAASSKLPRSIESPSGEMVLVDGGPALLGSSSAPRTVSLKPFYIDRTEVSQDRYSRFCKETGRALPKQPVSGANLPVVNVSFEDAAAFARWTGGRLPVADEWEKAARGNDGLKYPWGNAFKPGSANVPNPQDPRKVLMPVGSFQSGASPFRALNMLGNVWEWVNSPGTPPQGAEFARYKSLFKDLEPPLLSTEPYYSIRGGSAFWPSTAEQQAETLWDETPLPARARQKDVGFRCARDAQ